MNQLPEISFVPQPDNSPVIKRAALAQYRAANAHIEDARTQANQLLQAAQSEVEEIRGEAFQAGAVLGLQAALAPLLELAITLARSERELSLEAAQRVQECFSDMVAAAPALQTVLDNIIAARGLTAGPMLQITIPPDAADCADALRAHGAAQGMSVTVIVGQARGHLAIECAGHHWETHLEALHQLIPHPPHSPLLQESAGRMRLAQALREVAALIEA